MIGWIWLSCAIATEIAGTLGLRFSAGFTRFWPTALAIAGYVASTYFMALALKTISLSATYAIWSGVGTAVVAGIGMTMLGESASALKVFCILLIVLGVVGLEIAD